MCVCVCVCWAFCLNTECESTAVSFQVIIIFYHYCFLWGCFNISTAYASICGTNSRGLRSPESLSTAEQAFQWMDSWWERTQEEEVCVFLTGRDQRKYFRLNKLVIRGHDIISHRGQVSTALQSTNTQGWELNSITQIWKQTFFQLCLNDSFLDRGLAFQFCGITVTKVSQCRHGHTTDSNERYLNQKV